MSALILLAACGRHDPDAALTARVADRFVAAGVPAEVDPSVARTLRIDVPDADVTNVIALDTLAAKCTAEPTGCNDAIDEFVAVSIAMVRIAAVPPTADQLRATIRDTAYLEAMGDQLLSRPFVGDLIVVYVFEMEKSTRFVMDADLDLLGVDAATVDARAVANLDAAVPAFAPTALPDGTSRFDGDTFGAARLLLTDRWATWDAQAPGPLFALATGRDRLYIGEGDAAVVGPALRAHVAADAALGYALSPTLLEFTPSGWAASP